MKAASIALMSAVAVFSSAAVVATYHKVIVRPALAIGIVDVAAVYRAKEESLSVLFETGVGDDERQRAVQLARNFADRVGAALDQLSTDCACLLVSRSALAAASPRAVDLTPVLLSRVEQR